MKQSSPIVKSPFSDALGKSTIPNKGTGGGRFNDEPALPSGMNNPANSPNCPPLLFRDGGAERVSKLDSPKTSGGPVVNSPFKDPVNGRKS